MNASERRPELSFRPRVGLTATQAAEGITVYEATALGVRYEVEGYIIDTMAARPRRAFRAYRISGPLRRERIPAAEGGEHRTRAAAYAQAERDLAAVLAGRAPAVSGDPEYMDESLLDACGSADRGQELSVTTVIEDVTCTPCGRIARHATAAPRAEQLTQRQVWRWVLTAAMQSPEQVEAWINRHNVPVTPQELWDAIEADHAEALSINGNLSVERSAQRNALRRVLITLQDNIEGAREGHEALGHRGESTGSECWNQFHPDDIRQIVNSAAHHLGIYDL